MSDLILKSGGVLLKKCQNENAYDADDNLIGEPFYWVDVSNKVHNYLHIPLEIESVTVGEIYQMVEKSAVLSALFEGNFVESYITYLKSLKIEKYKKKWEDSLKKNSGIAAIELVRIAEFNPVSQSLTFGNYWSVSGQGVVLTRGSNGFKKGQRISWSLSMSPIENYYYTPVIFNPVIHAKAESGSTPNSGSNSVVFERNEITLFELIHAVTWEFSFYGTPESTKKEAEVLELAKEEAENIFKEALVVENKNKETSDSDNSTTDVEEKKNKFADLMDGYHTRYNYGFENIRVNPEIITDFICVLPREANLKSIVDIFLKDMATLKEEYNDMSVYDYVKIQYREDSDKNKTVIASDILKAMQEGKSLFPPKLYIKELQVVLKTLGHNYTLNDIKNKLKKVH